MPKSGALGLGLMGGMGMLIVGLVTAPQMGRIADRFVQQQLEVKHAQTVGVLERVVQQYPSLAEKSPFSPTFADWENVTRFSGPGGGARADFGS